MHDNCVRFGQTHRGIRTLRDKPLLSLLPWLPIIFIILANIVNVIVFPLTERRGENSGAFCRQAAKEVMSGCM